MAPARYRLSMNDAPIGIFDSGLGGLTVARSIIDKLPNEDVLYLGDTAHTPYGPRPIAEVRELTLAGLDVLAARGAKVLVIACNTATAAALSDARERYWSHRGIPVVEVLTPAAREAAATTRCGAVGVIGTQATVASEAYVTALAAVPGISVVQQACPAFVDFVERGITAGPELTEVTAQYMAPLKEAGVDTVILGCTHYPLLTGVLARELGEQVSLITSSEATARATYSLLVDLDMLHHPRPLGETEYKILTTAQSDRFNALARRFLGPEAMQTESLSAADLPDRFDADERDLT